ncbi:hypothetical protein TrLO_g1537 [Triparma laevis f. longispina]|uniref:Uncharacterized protein n=1 Tax=Triparma laevis f. longispina TaxID=1714387 RepID=A0A9W7FU97_9STRA|nr:hypothetical protein TrLO_g1537 [Triparma laevis f. longispina]
MQSKFSLSIPKCFAGIQRFKREKAKRDAKKKSARPGKLQKARLNPGNWSIYSQVACSMWMLSSGLIFGLIPCEFAEGFMWRWITFAYPLSSVINYLFLYAKQSVVKGTNPSAKTILLSKVFVGLVCCVPFIGLAYMLFLVKAIRVEDGTCMPVWEVWAPLLLCIGDTAISAICLYLFINPLYHSAKKMHATKDDKLVKVLKRNLTACGLTMSTSLVTLLGCTMCGPEEKHKSAVMFVASWVAFDKWTDVHAINVAFDDFSDFAMCGEGAKVKPDGTGSEEGGSTEASGASEEGKT